MRDDERQVQSEGVGIARSVLGAGGLLIVLLAATLLVRVGAHWLPFAWDPLTRWPTGGEVEPARVLRSELAILEDPLAAGSGRHRFQLFVLVASDHGEQWLAGPAREADDLVAGPGQLWTMVGEAAAVVGPLEPDLRVPAALVPGLTGGGAGDDSDRAAIERRRITGYVAWADEWPALAAFAPPAPLALRRDGTGVAVESQWRAEVERRAATSARVCGLALVGLATLIVFVAARVLVPIAAKRARALVALLVAASFPWWALQWPAFANWLAPPGSGSSLVAGVRDALDLTWLTRGADMPLHAATARERAALEPTVVLGLRQLHGYTPLVEWLAGVPLVPRPLSGYSWDRFAAAESAMFEAAATTVADTDDAVLARLDAELSQRTDAQDPEKPIARLRAAVTAELARRASASGGPS